MRRTRIGNRLAFYTARGIKPGRYTDQGHVALLAGYARQAVAEARNRSFFALAAPVDPSWLYTLPEQFRD